MLRRLRARKPSSWSSDPAVHDETPGCRAPDRPADPERLLVRYISWPRCWKAAVDSRFRRLDPEGTCERRHSKTCAVAWVQDVVYVRHECACICSAYDYYPIPKKARGLGLHRAPLLLLFTFSILNWAAYLLGPGNDDDGYLYLAGQPDQLELTS